MGKTKFGSDAVSASQSTSAASVRSRRKVWLYSIVLLLLALLVAFIHEKRSAGTPGQAAEEHRVFLTGADLSELPYCESQGVKYFDGGKPSDLLLIAKRNGWSVIRVRLWVDPDDDPEDAVSGLRDVTALGRRIKAAGFKFMLDIHYSDSFADPAKQYKPAAWATLAFPQLCRKVHDYTVHVIVHLRVNGATPDYVQVGNEITFGMLWGNGLNGATSELGGGFRENTPGGFDRTVQLLAAGLAGVRDASMNGEKPLTILHLSDGHDTASIKSFFTELSASEREQKIDLPFDIIGLSYYPADFWYPGYGYRVKSISSLTQSMDYIAETLHMPVMIVETNWPHDGVSPPWAGSPPFPYTPNGQVLYYKALEQAVRSVPGNRGLGVLAWSQAILDSYSVFDEKGNALPAVKTLGQG